MNELLAALRIEDLSGNDKEIAEVVGLGAFCRLVDHYGGTSKLYIPKADMLVIPKRNELICREFDGANYIELAKKWNLTERYIQDIVKEKRAEIRRKPMDGQLSLLDNL